MIEYYLRTAFPGEVRLYNEYVLDRALPPLDDLQGKADALERAHAEFQGLESFDGPEQGTGARAALAAERYFNDALALRHLLLGLFTLGLHHLVEQQFARIHGFLTRFHPVRFDAETPCEAIEAIGVRPRELRSWQILTELRCVANVAKHGEGDAARKLGKIRPDLFQHPAIKHLPAPTWLLESQVRSPLVGEDLYLDRVDFERYSGAVLTFWSELADSVQSAG